MAKGEEIPRTNPAEVENLIEQIRGTNLEPGAKEKIERLLRTVLLLVDLLQRKNASIKMLREMIFGKRTERHQAEEAEHQQKTDESGEVGDGAPQTPSDKEATPEGSATDSEHKPSRKGHGRRAASDYHGAKVVICQHQQRQAMLVQRPCVAGGSTISTSRRRCCNSPASR